MAWIISCFVGLAVISATWISVDALLLHYFVWAWGNTRKSGWVCRLGWYCWGPMKDELEDEFVAELKMMEDGHDALYLE